MAKTQDYTQVVNDMLNALPIDVAELEKTFKSTAKLNEQLSGVVLEAADQSNEISSKWAKNTIAKMVKISKAKADPADYAKALTDFASAAADEATRNFAGLAEVAKKAQTDSTEILMAAGKNAADQASAAVQKATDEAAKAAKKAAVAAR